jgi:N-acetylneuraminic acid mutarotase
MSSQLRKLACLRDGPCWRLAALTSLLLLMFGCGGGGGDGGSTSSNDPNRVGAGWITITNNTAGPTSSTAASTVGLGGDAFISPTWSGCCTGSASDTGVTVSWVNATKGVSGAANQKPQYCWLFEYFLCGHTWQATIDLVVGNNVITITATDPSGNLGRVTTTVTRTPDVTPPTVSATSPASGASAVGTNSAFTVTFSEAMDPATISTSTVVLKDNSNNPVSGSVAYSNSVATLTPAANLQGSTTYTATITTGVKDVAGNALVTAYVWSFTTGPAPDTTPPTVDSTSPANGATCVPTETPFVAATFSEAVLSQTVNTNTFLLKDSLNNPVGGTVGLDFSGPAKFFLNSPLANSSSYTGTITTALTDLSGNHLAADYTWTFTTQDAGTGTWNVASTIGAPAPRAGHTAVWTGTQMIVWGGGGATTFGDGARYDPATDTWTQISSVGAPSARDHHVAVWTGSKMIIWGGVQPGAYLNSGAIYDPATDTWAIMSSSGAPSARADPTAVWTGTEMIVWGGVGAGAIALGDGARYNPITNSWSAVSAAGAPAARSGHTAVWSGSAMLVWGGSDGSVFVTGGIYTPSSDGWTTITTTGAPAARQYHSAVWTGTEMIVWGGYDGTNALDTGARFNPSSNSWQSMASACVPLARFSHTGVWSGTELIVWGGSSGSNGYYYRAGGRYNPSTDTWQPTPVVGVSSARRNHTGIWTGTDMIVWGGLDVSVTSLNTGGSYRPQ